MIYLIWLFGATIVFTLSFLLRILIFTFNANMKMQRPIGVLRVKGYLNREQLNHLKEDWNKTMSDTPLYILQNANDADLKLINGRGVREDVQQLLNESNSQNNFASRQRKSI